MAKNHRGHEPHHVPGPGKRILALASKVARLRHLAILALPLLQGCSHPAPPTSAPQARIAAATPLPAVAIPASVVPVDTHEACGLVTGAEMSAILGNAVAATARDGSGVTACSYVPVNGSGSRAEIMVSWGDGESALKMMRSMTNHDAAGDVPYRDIGDDAVYQSPVVIVRQGKDLIGVAVFGRPDLSATVKRIIDTAKPKLAVNSLSMKAATDPANAALVSAR